MGLNVEQWTHWLVPLTAREIGRSTMLTGDGSPVAKFASAGIAVVIVLAVVVMVAVAFS